MQQEKFFCNSDNLQLFYRHFSRRDKTSTALPILCLHGMSRNSRDFLALAADLSARHDVIAADFRGSGFSDYDPNPQRYQPPTLANDMFELLDHVQIERCLIVGTSLGGIIAMLMAAQQPQRIAGIVLNDMGPQIEEAGLRRIAEFVVQRSETRNWDDAIAVSQRNFAAALPGLTTAQWRVFAEAGFRANAAGIPRADYDLALAQAFSNIDIANHTAQAWMLFGLVQQPILVLRGALSDLLSADGVAAMQQRHADVTAVDIPERGHVPLLNEPSSIAAIEKFLLRFAA